MKHKSETDTLIFPTSETTYLNTDVDFDILKEYVKNIIDMFKK